MMLIIPISQAEKLCSTEVMGRAEYIMEKNIITIIPIYHNYQDIRTFYTIKSQQTYRLKSLYLKVTLQTKSTDSLSPLVPGQPS